MTQATALEHYAGYFIAFLWCRILPLFRNVRIPSDHLFFRNDSFSTFPTFPLSRTRPSEIENVYSAIATARKIVRTAQKADFWPSPAPTYPRVTWNFSIVYQMVPIILPSNLRLQDLRVEDYLLCGLSMVLKAVARDLESSAYGTRYTSAATDLGPVHFDAYPTICCCKRRLYSIKMTIDIILGH